MSSRTLAEPNRGCDCWRSLRAGTQGGSLGSRSRIADFSSRSFASGKVASGMTVLWGVKKHLRAQHSDLVFYRGLAADGEDGDAEEGDGGADGDALCQGFAEERDAEDDAEDW